MRSISRRHFLRNAAAATVAFSALPKLAGCGSSHSGSNLDGFTGFGDLIPDPEGIMDLPAGFSYRVIADWKEPMDDGLLSPIGADGMAAFPGPDGRTILVRNHELFNLPKVAGPFGEENQLIGAVDPARVYDFGFGTPSLGGTTTLVYDTRSGRREKLFMSLLGTARNCAGGHTPWGTWITCEEQPSLANESYEQDHGYNFEVPPTTETGLILPVPLKAMGRFNHEAVAVDPASGAVYQTEDRYDGLLYRFLPNEPGNLVAGGRLQALALRDAPGVDPRNWTEQAVPLNTPMAARWIDLEDVESPRDDLRIQGANKGAALFARGEGIYTGSDGIYIACTAGGRQVDEALGGKSQIWRYVPSPSEGRAEEEQDPGRLELIFEPNDTSVLEQADNLVVAPWGDLLICEDGDGDFDRLVGLRPNGQSYVLAENVLDQSEFAGATFSPDGSTLFVNYQWSGKTFAVTGPWPRLR